MKDESVKALVNYLDGNEEIKREIIKYIEELEVKSFERENEELKGSVLMLRSKLKQMDEELKEEKLRSDFYKMKYEIYKLKDENNASALSKQSDFINQYIADRGIRENH